jgi:AcrR family transcriptional regulator
MQSEPTRNRILDAARDLFDAEGEEGLSMRRIAGAVGITPMAIYRHYADKEALKNALMLDGMAAWETRVKAIMTRAPLEWLEQLGVAFLEFALTEPRRYEAAFLLKASAARQYPGDFAAGRSPVIRMMHDRIEQARALGQVGTASTVAIGLAISALLQGLVSMYRAGRFASEAEFRMAYRQALRHCIQSFMKVPT